MIEKKGRIIGINGPVIKADNMTGFTMREMVMVGDKKLIGEVIILEKDMATLQVYEETEGLKVNEEIVATGRQLSVKLGPGIIGNIFDGIQRPLLKINEISRDFIPEGIGLLSIDTEKLWNVKLNVKVNDTVEEGQVYAEVQETDVVMHKLMVPYGVSGEISFVKPDGEYNIEEVVAKIRTKKGEEVDLKLYQEWSVRERRPVKKRNPISIPLITGQRIIDSFFPIAKGGTVAIPGGFGTGKTMTQHQLAKWSNADIIIYIGCGERGNEMTEVLEDFPKLIDPKTGKSLMERTVLIANTSNMPVAAREASIYTGITLAEYFRDMGYHVAIMADSTSRWAEALREISGRLEEMPAEEGYPAYLPSRIAEFYERAGYVTNLNGTDGSVTIIGAVSPAGGDLSEPVTQNTKRFVSAFLALDKRLAYERHYPAIDWIASYSGYVNLLKDWFDKAVCPEFMELRTKFLKLLAEENKLQEIVKLVGEDVLPDNQRLILETSRIIRVAILQQNAYNATDSFVSLEKQYRMLRAIDTFYECALKTVKLGAPISVVKDKDIYDRLFKMKYDILNNDFDKLDDLENSIKTFYSELCKKYV